MEHFTPISATSGGILIGLAAWLLLRFNGRIAGVSSVLAGTIPPAKGELLWRILFLAGIVLGAALYYASAGGAPQSRAHMPAPLLALGGLLVGAGTTLANGCTSGHGVCGLGRLSLRSLVATLVFLAAGMATAYVVRHLAGVAA